MNKETSFPDLIKKNFNFLLSEYNFMMHEKNSEFGETVVYQSPRLIIQICKDRGSLFILLLPSGEPELAQLGLLNILEALSFIVPDDFLGPIAPDQFDQSLASYAVWLKQYCENLLRGNLSSWKMLLKINLDRMKKKYTSATKGKQLPKRIYQELEEYIKTNRSLE